MKTIDNIKSEISKLESKASEFAASAKKVTEACHDIGKSWSGSTLVGHAKFFFKNFQEPSTENKFSIEWGLIHGIPEGWFERSDEEVRAKIEEKSGVKMDSLKNLAIELENGFLDTQRDIVLFFSEKGLLESEIEKVEKFTIKTATDYFNEIFPTRYMTRDSESMTGNYVVPHIYYDSIARFVSNYQRELKSFIFEVDKLSTQQSNRSSDSDSEKKSYFVENSILLQLSQIKSDKYDLTKLIKMCKELNDNFSLGNYISCGMLIRAILDHIPPIFDKGTFTEVVNNYGPKSFKDIIAPLEETARKISDSYLHNHIQKKEIIPGRMQVNFQPNMDVLLSEVIKILS